MKFFEFNLWEGSLLSLSDRVSYKYGGEYVIDGSHIVGNVDEFFGDMVVEILDAVARDECAREAVDCFVQDYLDQKFGLDSLVHPFDR